jgi:hypothetical protein
VSEDAPTNVILNAGGGGFEAAHVTLTQGVHVGADAMTVETIAEQIAKIRDRAGETVPDTGAAQGQRALAGQ